MDAVDPVSGRPLPGDAIQRVLFVASPVHVYSIPPPRRCGHVAASWTADPARHIFTARLRVLETALAAPAALSVAVVLEDPADGQLFAAGPYAASAAVEPAVDSSRFFALTVRDPAGRRALLGIGFEDRSDAFDFSVALQQARRSLAWDADQQPGQTAARAKESAKDYSLKEGETITVNLANTSIGRRRPQEHQEQQQQQQEKSAASGSQSFALPPPPSSSARSGAAFPLPPPPTADHVKRKRRSLRDLGFDDGQFGEFA